MFDPFGQRPGGGYNPYVPYHVVLLEQLARQFFLSVLPAGVKFVVKVVVVVFLIQQIVSYTIIQQLYFTPAAFLSGKIWLAWTGPLLHADVTHICLNMLACCSFHTPLERKFGTLRYLELVVWSMLFSKLCYVGLALAQVLFYFNTSILYQPVIGFSGVIFLLSVLECHLFPQLIREVHVPFFGNFRIQSKWYPWTVLMLCEFLMPHSSFTGHLAGILAGLAVQTGWVRPWYMPTDTLKAMENWESLRFLTHDRHYTDVPAFGSEPFGRPRRRKTSNDQVNATDDPKSPTAEHNVQGTNNKTKSDEKSANEQEEDQQQQEQEHEEPEHEEMPSQEEIRELRRRRYENVKVPSSKLKRAPVKAKKEKAWYDAPGKFAVRSDADSKTDGEGDEDSDGKQLSPEELRLLRQKRFAESNRKKVAKKKESSSSTTHSSTMNDYSRRDYQSESYRARVSAEWAEVNETDGNGFNPYRATSNGFDAYKSSRHSFGSSYD